MAQNTEVMKKVRAQVAALVEDAIRRAASELSEESMRQLQEARACVRAARACSIGARVCRRSAR